VTEVYLVRHAVAEDRDAGRWPDDSLRPLTGEGVERFARAARGLRRLVPTVQLLLSSPYLRAWQTAEILREKAGWPAPERCAALAAACPPEAALAVLRDRGGAGSIALVGHEPYLSSLASLLLAGDSAAVQLELKKGGVLALASDGDPGSGGALLRWSASPKILRALDLGRD
jgi:phosphohistidine phosphatase